MQLYTIMLLLVGAASVATLLVDDKHLNTRDEDQPVAHGICGLQLSLTEDLPRAKPAKASLQLHLTDGAEQPITKGYWTNPYPTDCCVEGYG